LTAADSVNTALSLADFLAVSQNARNESIQVHSIDSDYHGETGVRPDAADCVPVEHCSADYFCVSVRVDVRTRLLRRQSAARGRLVHEWLLSCSHSQPQQGVTSRWQDSLAT